MNMNAKEYRNHWATLSGRPASEIYVPSTLKQDLEQCEGCAEPLSDLLKDGWQSGDFNITWYVCEYHYLETQAYNGF